MNNMPGAPTFYVNVYQGAIGAYDVTIDFGHRQPPQSKPDEWDQLCRIIMSPSHAKHMVLLLGALIEQYERQFGSIPIPPGNPPPKEGDARRF